MFLSYLPGTLERPDYMRAHVRRRAAREGRAIPTRDRLDSQPFTNTRSTPNRRLTPTCTQRQAQYSTDAQQPGSGRLGHKRIIQVDTVVSISAT